MILKYCLLAFLVMWFITSSDNFHGLAPVKKPVKTIVTHSFEYEWKKTDAYDRYLNDDENLVSKDFKIDPYFYPNVAFWFLIYTQFDSSHVLIHDKKNLNIIYKVLNFSLPKTISAKVQKTTKDKMNEIKEVLKFLESNPFSHDPKTDFIHRILNQAEAIIPSDPIKRSTYFKELRDNLRSQTGQKNFIRDGIIRSLPYETFLKRFFEMRELPTELLAIPFLESSFNPNAHSRVSARGVWQFMPLTASYYMPKRTVIDYRSNVGISSISATALMSENYKIMKDWGLAVTAYNSGTRYLLKMRRKLPLVKVTLEDIIMNSKSDHFGFASKNFYSEFLALTHTLAYKDFLFDDLHDHERSDASENLHFFMAKCDLVLSQKLNTDQLSDVLFHNQQLVTNIKTYNRGVIFTAKSKLPAESFLELDEDQTLNRKPKDWIRYLKSQSCSTR